jgi:hypothetical protein
MLQDGAEENVELWSTTNTNFFENVWSRVSLPIQGTNVILLKATLH